MLRDLEWPEDTLEYKRERFMRKMEAVSSKRESHMGSRQESAANLVMANWQQVNTDGTRRCMSLVELPIYLREQMACVDTSAPGQCCASACASTVMHAVPLCRLFIGSIISATRTGRLGVAAVDIAHTAASALQHGPARSKSVAANMLQLIASNEAAGAPSIGVDALKEVLRMQRKQRVYSVASHFR